MTYQTEKARIRQKRFRQLRKIGLTYRQIGKLNGVTKQRAYQIVHAPLAGAELFTDTHLTDIDG